MGKAIMVHSYPAPFARLALSGYGLQIVEEKYSQWLLIKLVKPQVAAEINYIPGGKHFSGRYSGKLARLSHESHEAHKTNQKYAW